MRSVFATGPERVSIRRRIAGLATVLLLVAAGVLVVFIRNYAEHSSDQAFDRLLAASAATIAGAVLVENGAVIVELPLASFDMFTGSDRIFYSVQAPGGAFVTGYPDLSNGLELARSAVPSFADISYRGEAVRVASMGRLLSTAEETGWVTIRVAETEGARRALAGDIIENALAPIVTLTTLALLLIWFGVGRVFAPLRALERHLRSREPDNLSPVDIPAPVEVQQLVGALDGFMSRLASSRARLEALVAEAAHEVRTPLATLRAYAEIARDEKDPVVLRDLVERIHHGTVQASQLVSQLLMDATVSHRLETRERAQTPLANLMREVHGRLGLSDVERVEIEVEPEAQGLVLEGDRVVLREALRNLVDNALHYSDGPVSIDVRREGRASIAIAVRDRGPGILDVEKDLVLQRFKRGTAGAGKSGSGLGLSIVVRAAEANGGRFELCDRAGGGLTARLQLPLAAATEGAARPSPSAIPVALLAAVSLLAGAWPTLAAERLFAATGEHGETARLAIAGTTDTSLFVPLVEAFQSTRPGVAVYYFEGETLPLYEDFISGRLPFVPDILMSSASDLQVKLANDGYAQSHVPPNLSAVPEWAHWRSEVFGFSFEPAVFIYNPEALSQSEVPRTHNAFIQLLESDIERFRGRVATYDIETSGVGYLLATQDQAIASSFWRLTAALGRVGASLSGASPEILSRVESGELSLGYNVLGSYAFARQERGARIGIVVPDDYVLVLTRTMLIPRTAPNTGLAREFVDFVLSPEGQRVLAGPIALGSVVPGTSGRWTAEEYSLRGRGAIQPIPLGPPLLVPLDGQRRARFLDTWRGIVAPR